MEHFIQVIPQAIDIHKLIDFITQRDIPASIDQL